MIASTMITAPSTINPKSIAPSDIRLADTPNRFIIPMAKSMDNGMTDATINPPHVVCTGPAIDYTTPHDRKRLSA